MLDFYAHRMPISQLKRINWISILAVTMTTCSANGSEGFKETEYKIYADWICDFKLEGGIPFRELNAVGQHRAREFHCRMYGSVDVCHGNTRDSRVDWSEKRPVEEMSCKIRRYTAKEYILCKRYMQCP